MLHDGHSEDADICRDADVDLGARGDRVKLAQVGNSRAGFESGKGRLDLFRGRRFRRCV